jgi:hypothetical protein
VERSNAKAIVLTRLVVGLKELDLPFAHLGFFFTSMAVGSVLSGAFIGLRNQQEDESRSTTECKACYYKPVMP